MPDLQIVGLVNGILMTFIRDLALLPSQTEVVDYKNVFHRLKHSVVDHYLFHIEKRIKTRDIAKVNLVYGRAFDKSERLTVDNGIATVPVQVDLNRLNRANSPVSTVDIGRIVHAGMLHAAREFQFDNRLLIEANQLLEEEAYEFKHRIGRIVSSRNRVYKCQLEFSHDSQWATVRLVVWPREPGSARREYRRIVVRRRSYSGAFWEMAGALKWVGDNSIQYSSKYYDTKVIGFSAS